MTEPTPAEGVVSATSDADGIVIVRVFDAPRELVFKAWTEPERFATWFGEHGSSIPLETASMDPRPGGEWSAVMIHGPERIEIPFSGTFRDVVEPEVVELVLEVAGEALQGPPEVLAGRVPRSRRRPHRDDLHAAGQHACRRVLARDAGFADLLRPPRRPPG